MKKRGKNFILFDLFFFFFEHIQEEIRYFLRPSKEIFSGYQDPFLEKAGFLPALRSGALLAPATALKNAAAEYLPRLLPEKEMRDLCLSYCSRFGTLPLDLQLKSGDELLSFLQEKEKTIKKKNEDEIRLSRTLGTAAGIGILILFL